MSIDWNWALVVVGALLVLIEVALGGFAGFDLVLIGPRWRSAERWD